MSHTVEILMTEFVTHDVKRFILTRPDGLDYQPGQGVELAVDEPDWRDKGRPFTPTNLRGDGVLEFTIKGYPDHRGVTQKLHSLAAGAKLLMSDSFGVLTYQGPGLVHCRRRRHHPDDGHAQAPGRREQTRRPRPDLCQPHAR